MSSDEGFLVELLTALRQVKLEAVFVGGTAAVLQGAPVMTQDVDLLVRDIRLNRKKLKDLCRVMHLAALDASISADIFTLVGGAVPIDIIFGSLPGKLTFEAVRARASEIKIGGERAKTASLDDIVRSKVAANRPKDRAQLTVLRDTIRVKKKLSD